MAVQELAYINNIGLSTYGCKLVKGAYEALLLPPPAKEYISNKSRLQDGTRVVANSTNAKVDERTVNLSFYIEGSSRANFITKLQSFFNAIRSGEIAFNVVALNATYHLVYEKSAELKTYRREISGVYTVTFREPNPSNRS